MNFTQLVATFGYWVVLVFVAIQCAGIPFPGGAVLLAAAVGAILGNLLGYLLGSRGGYRLLVASVDAYWIPSISYSYR